MTMMLVNHPRPTLAATDTPIAQLHQNFSALSDFQQGARTVNTPAEKCLWSFEKSSRIALLDDVTSCVIALNATA